MLGFETAGNAIIVVYDGDPLLATDPWLSDSAYFGSWGQAYEITKENKDAIERCKYIWLSHGHPDHLDVSSLENSRSKKILLPDHAGGRISKDLTDLGFNVQVLKSGEWLRLSDRVRVLSLSDWNQDGILLVEVDGRLLINANDSSCRGWVPFIRRIAKKYKSSFYFRLVGVADANLINVFDESGNSLCHVKERPAKFMYEHAFVETRWMAAKNYVPSSSFHRYQREETTWINKKSPPNVWDNIPSPYNKTILPRHIRYDLEKNSFVSIAPPSRELIVKKASEFGDDWSIPLDKGDKDTLAKYFLKNQLLREKLGFIKFKVGGREHSLTINPDKSNIGIGFEVPRGSLMTTIQYEIFDDLMISNIPKATVYGDWGKGAAGRINKDVIRNLAKFGDNGRAFTEAGLKEYFSQYKKRHFIHYWWDHLEREGISRLRSQAKKAPLINVPIRSAYRYIKQLRMKTK